MNIVPDECVIEIDRRLLPGETPLEVHAGYERLVRSIPDVDAWCDPPMLSDQPLDTPVNERVVECGASVLCGLGLNGEPVGVPYGSDASKLSRAGVPSIVFGPGSIDQAHAAVEYVDCEEVRKAFEFYRAFLLAFD